MGIFRRKSQPTEEMMDYKQFVIDWLRELTEKDYEKLIKIVDIYREGDEKVKVIELGSKKALKESQKEEQADADLDNDLADFMEVGDGK